MVKENSQKIVKSIVNYFQEMETHTHMLYTQWSLKDVSPTESNV